MLYPKLLERDFDKMPAVLRNFHSTPGGARATGRVAVRHASPLTRFVYFPPRGEDMPLRLEVVATGDREVWTRRFGVSVRQSVQWRQGGLLLESMGPVRMRFRLFADSTGMRFESLGVRLWIIPLPLSVQATVRGLESSWEFEVKVPGIGSYSCSMVPVL